MRSFVYVPNYVDPQPTWWKALVQILEMMQIQMSRVEIDRLTPRALGTSAYVMLAPIIGDARAHGSLGLQDYFIEARRQLPVSQRFLYYFPGQVDMDAARAAGVDVAPSLLHILTCCFGSPRPLTDSQVYTIQQTAVQLELNFVLHELKRARRAGIERLGHAPVEIQRRVIDLYNLGDAEKLLTENSISLVELIIFFESLKERTR